MKSIGLAQESDDYFYVEREDLRIVDEELWHFCRTMSGRRHPTNGKTGARNLFLLSSKVRCPECGAIMRMARDRSKGAGRQLQCSNDFGPDKCKQHWRLDAGTLENIVVIEGLGDRYLHRRAEFSAEARKAFYVATKDQTRERAALEDEYQQLEKEIRTAAMNKSSAGQIFSAANDSIILEKEARAKVVEQELSVMHKTIEFPEDDRTLQGMEGVLDMMHREAPFLPKTPEEYDVRDFLRKVIVRVDIRWTKNDRADVVVQYDMGALNGLKTKIPVTQVYEDREVLFHRLLRRAAKQKTEQAAGADRYALTDAEWRARPEMPVFTSACAKLVCRGRKLVNALLLSLELDRPRDEAMSAIGTLSREYESALDLVRMSSDIEELIAWLAGIRPHIDNWDDLRLTRSKFGTLRMRFEDHPLLALNMLNGDRPACLSDAQWEEIFKGLKKIARYAPARTRRFIDMMLELIRNGAEPKIWIGSALISKQFNEWLMQFERCRNLERLSRFLLADEGKPTGPDKYPSLPRGNSKRTDSKRAKRKASGRK